MTTYKIRLDTRTWGRKSRRLQDFFYYLRKLLKTARATGMSMTDYHEKEGYAYITLDRR